MPWVEFLQNNNVDHFHRKSGDTADLRDAHAEALVRAGICRYTTDPNDQTGIATTDINTLAKLNAILTNSTLVETDDNWTGTEGSVVFVGANGGLDEDNDNFFWDDTADELGIGNKAPAARLHVSRDLSTGDGIRMTHSAEDSAAWALYSGTGGATPDFGVTGDGRVSIQETEPNTNAMLRIVAPDGMTGIASALIVNNEDVTADTYAVAQFTQSASGQDAVDITANAIDTFTALDVQANGLTTGSIATFRSSSASVATRELVEIVNDDALAVNAVPFYVKNDAAGQFIQLFKASTKIFQWNTDGSVLQLPIADGSETDTAPTDDHTIKKLSLQKLASAPTNAAYIAFSNNPGAESFYLVLEDG